MAIGPSRQILIGLGSNLGDRHSHLGAAIDHLHSLSHARDWRVSPVYATPAVEMRESGPSADFLNAAAVCFSPAPAAEWLADLQAIEQQIGRDGAKGSYRSRVIDLDLLGAGDEVVSASPHPDHPAERPPLVVPHPRLHTRWFVLRPLADLVPDWRHPVLGRTVVELLADLEAGPATVRGEACVATDDTRGGRHAARPV